jgi:hypothetical protein
MTTDQKIIKNKRGLLNLAEMLGNVICTTAAMAMARPALA